MLVAHARFLNRPLLQHRRSIDCNTRHRNPQTTSHDNYDDHDGSTSGRSGTFTACEPGSDLCTRCSRVGAFGRYVERSRCFANTY